MKTHSEQLAALGFTLVSWNPTPHIDTETDLQDVAYPVELRFKGKPVIATDFSVGLGYFGTPLEHLNAFEACKRAVKQNIKPELSDVLHSLLLDGEAFFSGSTFEDWADEYGYSSDSIKAKSIWEECDRTGRILSRHVPSDVLDKAREILADY